MTGTAISEAHAAPTLLRSTLWASAPKFLGVLSGLALSPFIVSRVGLAAFGFWSILLGINQYVLVSDGGFPVASIRLLAKARADGDPERLQRVLQVSASAMAVVGTVVTAITAVVVFCVLRGNADFPEGWQITVVGGIASVALTLFANAIAGVVRAFERWDLQAAAVIAGQATSIVLTFALLAAGVGFAALGIAAFVGSCALTAVHLFNARRFVRLRPSRSGFDGEAWRELRSQGTSLQVVAIVEATYAQADRFMLLPFASLSFIGAYALGARVAQTIRTFPLSAMGPLLSRLSAVGAQGGQAAVGDAYGELSRTLAFNAVMPFALFAGCAFPLVTLWLGPGYETASVAACVLCASYAFQFLTAPGTATAIALGRAQIDRNYNLIGLGLNVTLSLVFGLAFGPWGILAATAVSLVLSTFVLIWTVERWLARVRPDRASASTVVAVPWAAIVPTFMLSGFWGAACAVWQPDTRIGALGALALCLPTLLFMTATTGPVLSNVVDGARSKIGRPTGRTTGGRDGS